MQPSLELPAFEVGSLCWEGLHTLTYSGVRKSDRRRVLLRTLRAAEPKPHEIAAFRRDHEIARSLPLPCVARPLSLESHRGVPVAVFEDEGLRPLRSHLRAAPLAVDEALALGARIASALEQVHAHRVVYKNLSEDTLWLSPDGASVQLADFSIATRTPHQSPLVVGGVEGSPQYIAPEQTGRINRIIDYRVDQYALGVVLYRLLTGRLPFDSTDPYELIHCHIVRQPRAPSALVPGLPRAVSDVVMKLLSKTPEERYQRARGLRLDLERCLAEYKQTGTVENVVPGEQDSIEVFRIPQGLYGRELEKSDLLSAWKRVSRGVTHLLLVSGEPGIGKSALVNEIQRPIVQSRGYFVSGKFDQYKRNLPYSAVVQALGELVTQLLSEDEKQLARWKERLLAALGANARVVTDVIPNLELIVGTPPPVPELPPAEGRNRFIQVFRDLIRVFAREEHPLALFLDDLQWTDSASLSLLEALVTDPDTRYVLLVGAYRNTEVDPSHPLRLMLDSDRGVSAEHIALTGLLAPPVQELISDALRCKPAVAAGLAELVHQKTGGNPFFIDQFLRFLVAEGLVAFDPAASGWRWDLRKIRERGITDNVVELMSSKLKTLSLPTQEVLRTAATIGNTFGVQTLAQVTDRSWPVLGSQLREAMDKGLIVIPADGYQLADDPMLDDGADIARTLQLRFLHDRVQQAAYALVPDGEREALHLRIGRVLRASKSERDLADSPFDVVNHLNAARGLLPNEEERIKLARLNLLAARRARESTAYRDALDYLEVGMALLPEGAWQTLYRLTFDLYSERMGCEYQAGRPDEADRLFGTLLANVRSKLEKANVYYTKILVETNRNRNEEAIKLGLEALRMFGIDLPLRPSRARVLREVVEVRLRVRNRPAESLLDLPRLTDAERSEAMRLLVSICPAAYFSNQDLMTLCALKIVNMTLKYGTAPPSSYGYILYALVTGAVLGDYERGHAFGRLADTMSARDDDVLLRCKVFFIFTGLVDYWRRPIEESLARLHEVYKVALEAGDIQYATYTLQFILQLAMFRARPLDELFTEAERHDPYTRQTRDVITGSTLRFRRQFILALQGKTRGGISFSDDGFDEEAEVRSARESRNMTSIAYYLIPKLQLAYLLGDLATADEMAQQAEANKEGVLSQVLDTERRFYEGLTSAALLREKGTSGAGRHRKRLRAAIKAFARWSRNQSANFGQQHLLLQAEEAALEDRESDAMRLYDDAVEAARANGFLNIQALANELAGRHHHARGRRTVARAYLGEAAALYSRWGAKAKVDQLALLIPTQEPAEPPRLAVREEPAPPPSLDLIDMQAILRASEALMGEARLDRLLDKLLRITLEVAGAQRACVVLARDAELYVEAAFESEPEQMRVLLSTPLDSSGDLFPPVVYQVARTKSDVVIDDARADQRFGEHAYIVERGVRSVLGCPLIKQGVLIGVLYLENNLATGAFSPERMKALRLVSTEVATALENARLQDRLKEHRVALQTAQSKVELLEKATNHLSKFVPQSVRRIIEANPAAPQLAKRECDVSVLFLDIEGYTSLSERLSRAKVEYLIERYFSGFLDDIHENSGDINETSGDGLMIIFEHDDPIEHAKRAARTALAIRNKVRTINQDLQDRYDPLLVNIGINSGTAAVGSSRFEGSASTRYAYTASGPVTNLAARLGAYAVDGDVLMSKETARRVAGSFQIKDLGTRAFKNIAESVEVYRLVDIEAAPNGHTEPIAAK